MSSAARAWFIWSGICLLAFLGSNLIWSRTTRRLRPEGGVEVAPNVTLVKDGKLQLERVETHGWPLDYARTRTLLADHPGAGGENTERFNFVPLALDVLFFAALCFLLVSLFGTRRPDRFSWKLVLVWGVCIAVLAAVGLAPRDLFL